MCSIIVSVGDNEATQAYEEEMEVEEEKTPPVKANVCDSISV